MTNSGHRPTIVFMGTPDFAVASLRAIVYKGYHVSAVVTAADKPAGRGQQIRISPVKAAALELEIPVLQPINLKDNEFIQELRRLRADLFVVVAFRMLPEIVWAMPPLGTFNLHASLLPQYRGAAPINWAIINGEEETGLTTFFLNHEIDTGHILLQEKVPLSRSIDAGELHDILMNQGAGLIIKTIEGILNKGLVSTPQIIDDISVLKKAPKIFKTDCKIDWTLDAESIFNKIRGLSPYPAAWTTLETPEGKSFDIKLFACRVLSNEEAQVDAGIISIDNNRIIVGTQSNAIEILELQPAGKKRMSSEVFIRGFRDKLSKAI
jgi:methionyl-tRNA formyltransferase